MEHYLRFGINRHELKTYPTKKKSNKYREISYTKESDNILTFDIETSSGWMNEDGIIIPYSPYLSEEFWNNCKPYSLCYIWQFSFDDKVYYGRELKEFVNIIAQLPEDTHFIIYVHNLAFEFQFLTNIFKFREVFARNAHKPMYATLYSYPNIEFRCSYMLTRMSLETWGRELGLPKLTGALDYVKLRTPLSPLTDTEMSYCERDCKVVHKGIAKYLEKYKHLVNIPLTQTGEVRKVVKAMFKQDKPYMDNMIALLPKNAEMYKIMKDTFAGGYTHANYTYAGLVVRPKGGYGYAYDIASSYPAVMCSEKFPMTPFVLWGFNEKRMDCEKWAYLMYVEMSNVQAKTRNHYIQFSKCKNVKNAVTDNGRVISADKISMWMTEQDFLIIKKSYTLDYVVPRCYRSRKAYLPKTFVQYILQLYVNKTQYKGIEEKADIYAISKQFINSLFGMCVTDIIQDTVTFDGEEWGSVLASMEDIDEHLDELRDKKKNKGRTFLAYQFGIWITAYARRNLWWGILRYDHDVIYVDTDSIKSTVACDFSEYNKLIDDKINACCEALEIDSAMARPKDKKGIAHPLGHFAEEDKWTEFITLGAKRYCYRSAEDGQLHITVSGISKQAVIVLRNNIENFNDETVFDKDYFQKFKDDFESGEFWFDGLEGLTFDDACAKFKISDGTKKMHQYTEHGSVIWNIGEPDEYKTSKVYDRRGITLRPTSYSMSIADEYMELLMSAYNNMYLKVLER